MNPTNLRTSGRQGLVQDADFSLTRSLAAARSRTVATALRLALLMLASLAVGCENSGPTDTGAGGAGVIFDSSGGLDLPIADGENPAEDAAVAAEIAPTPNVGTAETATKDVPVGPDLPPACSEGGCACAENSQCASGYCLNDAGSAVCAFSCTPACPSGSACKTLKAGNDDVQVCVPKFARLCDPCNQDSDCQGGSAGTTALCLDYADGKGNSRGKYCAGACDAAGIAVQRYAANGALIGGEVVVNTFMTGAQITPSIGMDTAGNFAVGWNSIGQDGDIDGIYAQRFKSDGSTAGAEVAISQTKANEQQKPVVAMLGDGSFAVAWESFGQSPGNKYDVILRCYDAAGAAVGNEQLVNTTVTDNQQAPHIVPFADGRYLVVWQSFAEDGAGWGVYGQLLYKDCKAIGNQFIVHTTKASDQTAPRAAADVNGGFVIVWSSLGQDGDNYGSYAQLFDKTGGKAGGEFKLNAVTAGEQSKPMVAFLPNGNLVATGQTVGEDEAGHSIKSV